MTTISENISRINKAKSDIKNAIIAKGGSVADSDKIDTYATAIEALPSGGGTELPQNLSRLVTDDWGNPKKITIKGSVTKIQDNACKNGKLEEAIIGNGVTTIGESAFQGCTNLTGITIPDSVTTIDDFAFNSCKSIETIVIPDSVTSIGRETFYYCLNLTNITIGNGVTSIGYNVFAYCSRLSNVTIKAVTPPTLGGGAAIPYNVTSIYVPSDSVDAYKSASGWSSYADKIQPIQE